LAAVEDLPLDHFETRRDPTASAAIAVVLLGRRSYLELKLEPASAIRLVDEARLVGQPVPKDCGYIN